MDKNARGQGVIDSTLVATNSGAAIDTTSLGFVTNEDRILPTYQTLLRFVALPVVTGNTAGASFGTRKIFTFPQGRINIISNNCYFSQITFNTAAGVTGDISGTGSGDFSMGSTATADATLTGTDVDLLPSTPMLDPFVAGVGRSNAWATLAAAAIFSGITTALSLNLNVIIDDAAVADGAAADSVYFTGYSKVTWQNFGDDVTEA